MTDTSLITAALLFPESALMFGLAEWDLVIRQGRRANLLANLAFRLSRQQLMNLVPEGPRHHLLSATRMAERQEQAIRNEVSCISSALSGVQVNVILLKGAAYAMAGLQLAAGRLFSDVDILVPKACISEVESALMIHGWQGSHHDAYDQRYYRQWMHEIPPMMHVRRGTTIDVHHAILPETARIKVNTKALLKDPLPVDGFRNIFVLKPIDMLLHSATHLFHEGEFHNGLRDLFDLDSLFREFSVDPLFWEGLIGRASELGLERPLYYAVTASADILGTPFPTDVMNTVKKMAPPIGIDWLMGACFRHVLCPHHQSCEVRGEGFPRLVLYIRSHWIRMPAHLLAYHLGHKAFTRHPKIDPAQVGEQQA